MKENKNQITENEKSCGVKCPIHGNLKVYKRRLQGIVKKKFEKRIVIEFERLIYYKKYERFARAKTKIHAFLPTCMKDSINIGDSVIIGKCRPLSQIIHFVVLSKINGEDNKK